MTGIFLQYKQLSVNLKLLSKLKLSLTSLYMSLQCKTDLSIQPI